MAMLTPANETSKELTLRRSHEDACTTAFIAQCQQFTSVINTILNDARKDLGNLTAAERNNTPGDDIRAIIMMREGELKRVNAIKDKKFIVPKALNQVQPPGRFYMEFSTDSVARFWGMKWNTDVACSLYQWASLGDPVDIPANFKVPVIGEIMASTFKACADSTWRFVVAPRLEKEEIRYDDDSVATLVLNQTSLTIRKYIDLRKGYAQCMRTRHR